MEHEMGGEPKRLGEEREGLRACPFCGDMILYIEGEEGMTYVMCERCGAMGPSGHDEDEAIAHWNTRRPRNHRTFMSGALRALSIQADDYPFAKPEPAPTSSEPTPTNTATSPDALLDPVNRPAHYEGDGEVPCMRAMRSMMHGADVTPIQAYWWGCAFKYLWRIFGKGNPGQDIDKAIRCLNYLADETLVPSEGDQ